MSAHSITHMFERMHGPSPQKIRRLFASYLLFKRVPVHVVGALLGHAPGGPVLGVLPWMDERGRQSGSSVTFRHYARPFAEELVDAVETVARGLAWAANGPAELGLPPAPMQRIRAKRSAKNSKAALKRTGTGGRR